MDVVLINPPFQRRVGSGYVEPIGLASLASSLRAQGATVGLIDAANQLGDADGVFGALRELLRSRMDEIQAAPIVGIGPLVTATLEATEFIVECVRAHSSSRIVLGGPLCSTPGIHRAVPAYLDVDAYVAGDGEDSIVALWRLPANEWGVAVLPGVGWPGGPEPVPQRILDLDRLPIPDRTYLGGTLPSVRRSLGGPRTTAAFLSRGCPYSCTFCAAPLTSGRQVRRFSSARVTKEIQGCMKLGYDNIIFYDDCLFVRGAALDQRIREFTTSLTSAGWRGTYQLELRCDSVVAMSDESLASLRETGLRQANMGIEKAHVSALKQIKKRLTPEIVVQSCERLRDAGIRSAGTFILGGPGEEVGDLVALGEYGASLPLDFAHFNPLAIYPGTALFDDVFGPDADWLPLCLDRDLAPRGDILWRSDAVPLSAIGEAAAKAYTNFYTDERMRDLLSRTPDTEHDQIASAYSILRHTRATLLTAAGGSPNGGWAGAC